MDLARQSRHLLKLFSGLDRAHGRYTPRATGTGGKQTGSAALIKEPATEKLWARHLAGDYGLGMVPIRDDGTCSWGAIDVDDYDLDLITVETEVRALGLPLVVCRTKSGGAHLYVFTKKPLLAELIRDRLMEWAVALGYPGVEVFPKQVRLASRNDFGNWLNMPYYGGDRTTRYAIHQGSSLDVAGFLKLAGTMRLTEDKLRAVRVTVDTAGDLLIEAPPCLQNLARRGIPEGQRNEALFNFSVYLRHRYGDEWEKYPDTYNQRFLSPPLGHREVANITKSVGRRKDYNYRCQHPPIKPVCNRQICLTRRFGVGGDPDDPGVTFGPIVKIETDPPTWLWDVDGRRLELRTEDLMDQRRFHRLCIDLLDRWPSPIRGAVWRTLVDRHLGEAEHQAAPEDASASGQLWQYLEEYCLTMPSARARDELLLARPWTEGGRTYFIARDFMRFLRQQRFQIETKNLYLRLRERGIDHAFFNLKGRGCNCWSIPEFEHQTEPFDTPRREDNEEF